MLPPDRLLYRLDLALHHLATGTRAGETLAKRGEGGLELNQIREWNAGDDWRRLDPAATARTNIPHIRVPVAERNSTLWLAVDTSASMAFSTQASEKYEIGLSAAATFGLLALRRSAHVGGLSLTEKTRIIPPRSGKPALLALLKELSPHTPDSPRQQNPTHDLKTGIEYTGRLLRREEILVLVSDFRSGLPSPPLSEKQRFSRLSMLAPFGNSSRLKTENTHSTPHETHTTNGKHPAHLGKANWETALTALAKRHDVFCIEVFDPREEDLPNVGIARFTDPETGRSFTVDTRSKAVRDEFRRIAAFQKEAIAAGLQASGSTHIRLSTADDWLNKLITHIEQWRKRRWALTNP